MGTKVNDIKNTCAPFNPFCFLGQVHEKKKKKKNEGKRRTSLFLSNVSEFLVHSNPTNSAIRPNPNEGIWRFSAALEDVALPAPVVVVVEAGVEPPALDAPDTDAGAEVVPADADLLEETEPELEAEPEETPLLDPSPEVGMLRLVPVPLLTSEALNGAVLVTLPVAERPAALQT